MSTRDRVDDEYAKAVCKIGQGAACCRYLTMAGAKGWSCEKLAPLAATIDARTDMVSKGDNCEGRMSL